MDSPFGKVATVISLVTALLTLFAFVTGIASLGELKTTCADPQDEGEAFGCGAIRLTHSGLWDRNDPMKVPFMTGRWLSLSFLGFWAGCLFGLAVASYAIALARPRSPTAIGFSFFIMFVAVGLGGPIVEDSVRAAKWTTLAETVNHSFLGSVTAGLGLFFGMYLSRHRLEEAKRRHEQNRAKNEE